MYTKKKEKEEEKRERERGRQRERHRRGKILAALHGILGPTGAAVPGENPFTGYTLWPRQCFLKRTE